MSRSPDQALAEPTPHPLVVDAYLPHAIADRFHTLDGACVAAWLRSQAYEVVSHRDTGRNGLAVTACGFSVSTNGFVGRA